MSESVRNLLVRGVAAAKTGQERDKQEARFYLEWVLRSADATSQQKATAWLWLGEIESDPAKKRDCLENVLANDQTNAPARRGLALLDGRLKPEDLIDPNQPIAPVKPDETPAPASVRRYACPKCGGNMSFVAGQRALACDYCGHRLYEFQAIQQGALIGEQDFIVTLSTAKAHRWELPAERTLKCEGCGATFALPPGHTSGQCPFCGSKHVIAAQTSELIQPEAMLPFYLPAEQALQQARRWLDRQKFRPNDLDERSAIARPRGVFLPFWTFDLGGLMNWHAAVAEKHGNQTVWVPRSDVYLVYHNDLLVPATHSIAPELLSEASEAIEYDTTALTPYAPELLADATAEVYQIPLANASLVARQRALKLGQAHVASHALAGESYRDFFMNTAGLMIESYKLILLPAWLTRFRYKQQTYPLFINGQSGAVGGKVPRSRWQQALAGFFGA
jgi:DNA-directed RNA polymerase subunit RPC12/RpoP